MSGNEALLSSQSRSALLEVSQADDVSSFSFVGFIQFSLCHLATAGQRYEFFVICLQCKISCTLGASSQSG